MIFVFVVVSFFPCFSFIRGKGEGCLGLVSFYFCYFYWNYLRHGCCSWNQPSAVHTAVSSDSWKVFFFFSISELLLSEHWTVSVSACVVFTLVYVYTTWSSNEMTDQLSLSPTCTVICLCAYTIHSFSPAHLLKSVAAHVMSLLCRQPVGVSISAQWRTHQLLYSRQTCWHRIRLCFWYE